MASYELAKYKNREDTILKLKIKTENITIDASGTKKEQILIRAITCNQIEKLKGDVKKSMQAIRIDQRDMIESPH